MNKTRLFVTTSFLITCCLVQFAVAQIPTTTVKRGFKIEYSNILPNATSGQAPFRVRISRIPAVPAANNQSFNVSVSNGWRFDDVSASSSSAELILPAGKTSAEVELLFWQENGYCSLLVEQSRTHTNSRGDDLLSERLDVNQGGRTGNRNWLLISSNAPKTASSSKVCYPGQMVSNNFNSGRVNTTTFNGSFGDGNAIPGLRRIFQEPLDDMLNRDNWHALQPAELPQTWVGLSAINYILIPNDEYKSITQIPAYRKIIEQWVAAGGCLIVFNPEKSLAHADSIFPALIGPDRATPARRWAPFDPNKKGPSVRNPQGATYEPASDLVPKDRAAFSPYLNGVVVVMVSPATLPNAFKRRYFSDSEPIITQAFRVSDLGQESPIPGVGKPPIALFGIITGLFLFLIGPVILVIVTLNNSRRFLFFMVPVFSFLTCTSILGYAIIADFNKQLGRTDTITALDSQSGFAFSTASSAYYCGSQPSYYAYDTDTLIQTTVVDGGYRIRHLPEENRISSPRIQPRKSHEVYTAKPYPSLQRFVVAESADKANVPEVTNLLGGRIERAFFEFKGKSYIVRDLEPKQTAIAIQLPFDKCRKEMRQTISNRQSRGGSPIFRAISSRISLIASYQETRNFVAVINVNPAIEPLIEPFDYKLQLHVVHGKY